MAAYFEFLPSPLAKFGITDRPRLEESFIAGTAIRLDPKGPLHFPTDATAENPPPDYTGMVIPVMSDRLLNALQVVGVENLQCFNAILENPKTGESWSRYKAVNIIGLVACADKRRSVYKKIGGSLYIFSELVIKEGKIKKQLFFRLAEAPATIIAHKSIGDYLYGGDCPKMTGFRFWPTDAESLRKMRNAPLP